MSNRIDFFQSAQTQMSLCCAAVSVLLENSPCPYLEPVEVVRGGWPGFSWARLLYNPAQQTEESSVFVEDIETILGMGKAVCIRGFYNAGVSGASIYDYPIFTGNIETIETKLESDGERVEVIVKDFSAALQRTTVYGQKVRDANDAILFLSGADTVFNYGGKPNAAVEPVVNNGNSLTIFSAEQAGSKFWGYAEVINYLLREYLPIGRLEIPDIELLQTLTTNQTVRDLDVTGLNLLEALHRCCQRIGLEFKFVPRPVSTGPAQAIVFYKNGIGRTIELNCQPTGEKLSISKTNIIQLNSKRNFWPVTHKHIGQGDFKVYEATFDLIKGWEPDLEDTDYDTFSPSTNPEFYKVKDVYRKWCLNEAGDYSGTPYNQGQAFDFSKIFQNSNFISRRRRFRPAVSTDSQGKSLGYFLQVSFDNGQNWWQYLYAFNNLLEECGIWLSSDQLDVDTWVAALKGVLKFRITASVVSDERLSCMVADGPVDSTAPVIEHIITRPRQFKYQKVSSQSVFYGSTNKANELDDSTVLYEFTRKKAEAISSVIENIQIKTPFIVFDYHPGDRVVSSPESRDLLSVRNDNRSIAWIEQVHMDFEGQSTILKIVRQRKSYE